MASQRVGSWSKSRRWVDLRICEAWRWRRRHSDVDETRGGLDRTLGRLDRKLVTRLLLFGLSEELCICSPSVSISSFLTFLMLC